MNEPKTLWAARFRASPASALLDLSRSPESHYRLLPYDIAASKVHARELVRAGILIDQECSEICAALDRISVEFVAGQLVPTPDDEDIHTFVERVLVQRLGAMGGKLRAGRSRNDQAANNLKLYLRVQARNLARDIATLQGALIRRAKEHVSAIAPGFTHLQPGQPVLFSHQLLAHAQTYRRDVDRLRDWDRRAGTSPLGAAALAGSSITRHPEMAAVELGYDSAMENSIDAVGSRDHVCEFLFVVAMFAVHVSRLAEEIVLWSSQQFRWVTLSDAFATGSSIMPQKKNADIAEIARGRSALLIGNLSSMLSVLKGLPFSYNRDMFVDKELVFASIDGLGIIIPAMTGLVQTFEVNVAQMRKQAGEGFILATEIADWLAHRGVPFAEAHTITGAVVKFCEERNIDLASISEEDMRSLDPRLDSSVKDVLTLEAAVGARQGYGGTAPERVSEQLQRLQASIADNETWSRSYKGPSA